DHRKLPEIDCNSDGTRRPIQAGKRPLGGVRAVVRCLPRHHRAEPFAESAPTPLLASTAPARPGDHSERRRQTCRFCGPAQKCWRHAHEHTARKKPDYRLTVASPGPKIEIKMAIGFAHQEEKTRRVVPDFLQNLFERYELASSFAHTDRLAAARELYHLNQNDLQDARFIAQSLHRRFQARHIAMMIGTPDVDKLLEFSLELVSVISDVASEISKLAVSFDHGAVLGVAELR